MSSSPVESSLLARLRELYPADADDKTWALVAACAFSAANFPDAVPQVFSSAIEGETSHDKRLAFARKLRDALFKSAMLCGYPKGINALARLHASMPAELQDKEPLRNLSTTSEDWQRIGEDLFAQTYGEKTDDVRKLLYDIYPDLGYFCMNPAYGFVYGGGGVLTSAEMSFAFVAALIASDVPTQIDWHLQGARRHGASIEQVRAVREIAIEAARAAGVSWKTAVPEVSQ
ncbi:AhpD-like protein [Schizophyllum commune]